MTVIRFSTFAASAIALAVAAAAPAQAQGSPTELVRPGPVRPATVESSWTPLRLPNGDRIALLGLSYLMAVDEEWGFGPSVYGAAQGNYGGLFTMGFTGQRRWRLSSSTHLAAGLYAGAGGGVGSDQVRFGGGLMLRPELSLRMQSGPWYGGLALAHTRFPSGNISDTSLGLVLGRASNFVSFAPSDAGKPGRASQRTGLGFDEIALQGGFAYPAINVTSSITVNAALRGFAEAGSDGILQASTGGAEFASGTKVKDMVTGAVGLAEFTRVVAEKYG
uniref:class II fructose-bisphosphate aldolase n=1 Tax=Roseateles sp. TaxID=1971397 RepID=UPI00286B63E4